MKIKKIILVACLLLAILAMGSVNASDESADLSAACDVGDESLKDSIAQDEYIKSIKRIENIWCC